MNLYKERPLNRIPGESRAANAALRDYYLMGAGRSLRDLLKEYNRQTADESQTKKPPTLSWGTLSGWSVKHHWQSRIAAQKEIDDAIALEQYRERHMSSPEVLALLADQARGDIANFASVEAFADLLDNPDSRIVKKIKRTTRQSKDGETTTYIELELYDAQSALEKIGRHHGLFTDKIDIKLEKELEATLDALERNLEPELYERILGILSASGDSESSPE